MHFLKHRYSWTLPTGPCVEIVLQGKDGERQCGLEFGIMDPEEDIGVDLGC